MTQKSIKVYKSLVIQSLHSSHPFIVQSYLLDGNDMLLFKTCVVTKRIRFVYE